MHWISIVGIIAIALGTFLVHFGNSKKRIESNKELIAKIEQQQGIISQLDVTIKGQEESISNLDKEVKSKTLQLGQQITSASSISQQNQKSILSKTSKNGTIDELDTYVLSSLTISKREFTNKISKLYIAFGLKDIPEYTGNVGEEIAARFNELTQSKRNYEDILSNLLELSNRTKESKIIDASKKLIAESNKLFKVLALDKQFSEERPIINTGQLNLHYKELIKTISEHK